PFDFDDARAEVGEQLGGVGPGDMAREVEHGQAFECVHRQTFSSAGNSIAAMLLTAAAGCACLAANRRDVMGDRVVGPLREIRQPLHEGLRQLQAAARAVSTGDTATALAAVDAALEYLDGQLLPHCRAEEFTLF